MNIDISDIKEQVCIDGHKRYVLDSISKIIIWIQYKMNEQEFNAKSHHWEIEPEINLSNCIIGTEKDAKLNNIFRLLHLIKQTKADGYDYFDCDGYDHNFSKRIVNYKFICNNSIFLLWRFPKNNILEKC